MQKKAVKAQGDVLQGKFDGKVSADSLTNAFSWCFSRRRVMMPFPIPFPDAFTS